MKSTFVATIAICLAAISGVAQPSTPEQINRLSPEDEALSPLHFLASDELKGRSTTRPEIHVAADYISGQFRRFGVKSAPGVQDYFQSFDLVVSRPANSGELSLGGTTYEFGRQLLQAGGGDVALQAPVVFAGYGTKEELAKLDVKGKIVVTNMGLTDSSSFREGYQAMDNKRKWAAEKGAVALVERFKQAGFPWENLRHHFMDERVAPAAAATLPAFILNDAAAAILPALQNGPVATLKSAGNAINTLTARNVVGMVEGSDPKLKDQYIVLSAHYDHVGVAPQAKMENGKADSIYNGARDNAIGVAAIINAARYFARHPAKRSILFVAYTGEEMGLMGSKYFAEHPVVPLEQMVYNLNIDNGGYNDTTVVTVVGLGRTSAEADIKKAAAAYGLTAIPDPAPEQNLFDRSDNVNLARKGVPAPTYSMGFRQFDETITRYYHQVSDEVSSFDLRYGLKYMRSFILAARYIADNPAQPIWQVGDKYEAAWKSLYRKAF